MTYTIATGFHVSERDQVAQLYWEAFAAKLRYVLGPADKALAFISANLNPDFALIARAEDRTILGVAGFKTGQGALIDAGLRDLAKSYGWLSTCWRGPLLALVERDLEEGVLLMDGICVAQHARSMGLGTALLRAIKAEAKAQGLGAVRLDVIDTNPRARALYEREGFTPIGQETLGPLSTVFGFRSSTKMHCLIPN